MRYQGPVQTTVILVPVQGGLTDFAETAFSISEKNNKTAEFAKIKDYIRENFSVENWDYEGALQITSKTLEAAEKLIDDLNWNTPIPDIFPSLNGKIAMSWRKDEDTLNLTISEQNEIAYNYLSDETELFGKSKLEASQIPPALKNLIELFNR